MRAACFILVAILLHPVWAEDHSQEQNDKPAPTRIEATQKLPDKVIRFITKYFFSDGYETAVRERYDSQIPPAIEKVLQSKDEEDLSKIIAELNGLVNLEQATAIAESAKKAAKEERRDPDKTDERYALFLDRLVWATQIRLEKEEADEKAQKFNEQFKKDYEKTKDWNRTVNEKIGQAASGVESAKKWIHEKVSMKTVLAFAENQRKSGNTPSGNKVIDALSTKTGKEKHLDMWGKGPEPQRLFLGKDEDSLKKAVDSYYDTKQTFGGNVASRKPHPTSPKKSWYVSDDSQFQTGQPKDFPIANAVGRVDTSVDTSIHPLRKLVREGSCMSCHSGISIEGTSLLDAKITVRAGKPAVALKNMAQVFNREPTMAALPDATKNSLLQWAEIQRQGEKKE